MTLRAALAVALLWPGIAMSGECPAPPHPVVSLSFDSRYVPQDDSRSEIDPDARDLAEAAIAPVDTFLRDLVRAANRVVAGHPAADADCLAAQLAVWARADALSDLGSDTARLTIGARLAGFALVLRQIMPATTRSEDVDAIRHWLVTRMEEQIDFWQDAAPPGAREGNLRAWAALAGAAIAGFSDEAAIRDWSAASLTDVLCTVAPDGSIPQEMRRGRLALHYQLHAIGPLVTGVLILAEQDMPIFTTSVAVRLAGRSSLPWMTWQPAPRHRPSPARCKASSTAPPRSGAFTSPGSRPICAFPTCPAATNSTGWPMTGGR
jgi:poly(beta-D-mannuronate) lyase